MEQTTASQTGNLLKKMTERTVVFDVETTTSNKGSAFDTTNKLVLMQVKVNDEPPQAFFQEDFDKCIDILKSASMVITFNGKFDLHWLQREFGVKVDSVWDVQLAEFLFSRQTWKYPDLRTTCESYEVQQKLDIVYDEYWSKGIDTTEIPREVLAEYGLGDVESTYQCYKKQLELFMTTNQHLFKLFRLQCNDLLVLQEMEYNGILYNTDGSLVRSAELQRQVEHLEGLLYEYFNGVPCNLDSRDHISALLYGGVIAEETRVPIGVYKTGAKIGQVRYKIVEQTYDLPRLVDPLKGSELKKEGYFATDEPTLKMLKANATVKKIVNWLLERSKLVKLRSTYLEGLPKIINEKNWAGNVLHPNYNQCMAGTGRLSSTSPNAQNFAPEAKKYCISRF